MQTEKHISITQTGHGHYRVTMLIYGKPFSTITTDSISVDEYRDSDSKRRSNRGYKALYNELMRNYRKSK
jgi:hypothetical protein